MSGRAFDNNCNCLDKQLQLHNPHSAYLYSASASGILLSNSANSKQQNGKNFIETK